MTDLRKAAEMALEALDCLPWQASPIAIEATKALRQALAQPEQEPVGYVTDSGTAAYFLKGVDLDDDTPLYTAPPKREWVGLTEADIYEAMDFDDEFEFARAIEAKLKEKNGG
jgi:hypothetical protein